MEKRKKDEQYLEMSKLHQCGMTLTEVGSLYSVKSSTVRDGFKRRGYSIRPRKLLTPQFVLGRKFTLRKDGYYQATRGKGRPLMHRYVAQRIKKRKIKELEVHHKDGDRSNNDSKNLVICSAEDHLDLHGGRFHWG